MTSTIGKALMASFALPTGTGGNLLQNPSSIPWLSSWSKKRQFQHLSSIIVTVD